MAWASPATGQITPPYQQRATTGSLDAAQEATSLDARGLGVVAFQLTGTWSATVTFESTLNTTYVSASVRTSTSQTAVSSATTNGIYVMTVSGYATVRARVSAYTSGTVTVTILGTMAAADALGSNNVAQLGGASINTGSGTIDTGTIRTTIATDDPVNDAAVEVSASIGTTAAAVPASAVQVGGTDGTNLTVPYIDPCQREARTTYVVDIVTATTTEIANQVASEFFWLCSVHLFTAGINNVAIVEDDTNDCASPTAGLNGGVTAAEGYNFIANQGIVVGTGEFYIMRTATANRYLCIITSAAVQLSGTITLVSAP